MKWEWYMNRNNKIFMLIAVMSVCLWFSGCGSQHDGKQNNNTDVEEQTIQNLRDYCVDEGGKNIYFITTENNTVYSYGLGLIYRIELVDEGKTKEKRTKIALANELDRSSKRQHLPNLCNVGC